MGIKGLSKVQLGAETTPGGAVAATMIWRGPFVGLRDDRAVKFVDENIGRPVKSSRNYVEALGGGLAMPSQELTPEQFPQVLRAGIKEVDTGVADGTLSSGYIYAYPLGLANVNTIKTFTLESGDDAQAYEAEYAFVTGLKIAATRRSAVMMSADWVARQVALSAFTGALSPIGVSELKGQAGRLWIDNAGGAFGTTVVAAGNLLEASFELTTGWKPGETIDSGQLYFFDHYFDYESFNAKLTLKWLHATAALAEIAKWHANDSRLIRLEFTGKAYGTVGSGTMFDGRHGIRIDLPGAYETFSAIEFDEGRSIVTATFAGGYEATGDDGLEITVANELASL